MTKQEVRDELKETEGNPQIKARVRRIQRDLARRNMMKEIPKATAVIVNPTHYSVAIRYEMERMAAPMVLAKGKNYLARRIRQIALEHQVPMVENQPLAQALYKSADVGQEIPPHLYRAVAEVLAYIFKLMQEKVDGTTARAPPSKTSRPAAAGSGLKPLPGRPRKGLRLRGQLARVRRARRGPRHRAGDDHAAAAVPAGHSDQRQYHAVGGGAAGLALHHQAGGLQRFPDHACC